MSTSWVSTTDPEAERPMRHRSCWIALPSGEVHLGFFGRSSEPVFLHFETGEVAWRYIDETIVTPAPTHWMYVEAPAHPGAE